MIVNSELYKELKGCLDSNQAVFEVLFVYHSLKPVCRFLLSRERLNSLRRISRKFGFSVTIQDYKYGDFEDRGRRGFQNIGIKVPLDKSHGRFIVYISLNSREGESAKKYERENGGDFGKTLGYPQCCIDFFMESIKEQRNKNMDFIIPACKKLSVYPFVNNRCIRYFGWTVLSHFPCSFGCEESQKMGESFHDLINQYDNKLAKIYKTQLSSFVLYSENNGIFYSPEYTWENNIIKFGSITGTVKDDNSIYWLLEEHHWIDCKSHNRFKIGKHVFYNGDEVVLMFK